MQDNIVQAIPKRQDMPHLIVYSIAQYLEGEIIIHDGPGENFIYSLPGEITNIGIIINIIGISRFKKG